VPKEVKSAIEITPISDVSELLRIAGILKNGENQKKDIEKV